MGDNRDNTTYYKAERLQMSSKIGATANPRYLKTLSNRNGCHRDHRRSLARYLDRLVYKTDPAYRIVTATVRLKTGYFKQVWPRRKSRRTIPTILCWQLGIP